VRSLRSSHIVCRKLWPPHGEHASAVSHSGSRPSSLLVPRSHTSPRGPIRRSEISHVSTAEGAPATSQFCGTHSDGSQSDTVATDHARLIFAGKREMGRGDFTKIPTASQVENASTF